MGVVYLAARADLAFEKVVAIKVVRGAFPSDIVLQRFRDERRILATLEHPNIARLLDGGATSDGLSYFVMEYVDGIPFDVYCETAGLSVTERLGCSVRSAPQCSTRTSGSSSTVTSKRATFW